MKTIIDLKNKKELIEAFLLKLVNALNTNKNYLCLFRQIKM